MWVFGYGSLMADEWEDRYGCVRRTIATLHGFRRTFTKASTKNWGSKEVPCPTLNLEKVENAECRGVAFHFPDPSDMAVRTYLAEREGEGFPLEEVAIYLEEGTKVPAYTPIYHGSNLITIGETEKAHMIGQALGSNGSCRSYIKQVVDLLDSLHIEDTAVSSLWKAVQDVAFNVLINETRGRIELLEASLPKALDGYALCPTSKLPMKALLYREGLMWRMSELSRTGFENLEKENLNTAVILVRAAVETTAALWYLETKLEEAVTKKSKSDIDDFLMKLLMGSKTAPELPPAINVLTFVDRVNRDVEGFREQYDNLSEFAHPNWAGTSLLYSKSDPKTARTEFAKNIRSLTSTKRVAMVNLNVALMIFERTYEKVGNVMPAFVKLCSEAEESSAPSFPG
jgi:cation transport regulator ChaC